VEIGELVSVPSPDQAMDEDCPFSHEKPNPREKNELGGIGTTLGNNMKLGNGVHTSKPPFGGDYTAGESVADPRDRLYPIRSVVIQVKGETITLLGVPLQYPLTCAAHHLIPAQESLKGHEILNFMCKKGENQDFRNDAAAAPAPVADSKVWGNVAYNVNGCHNGAWLPGNYAVGAGTGGAAVWKAAGFRLTHLGAEAAKNWASALDLEPDEWQPQSVDPAENEGPQSLADALATAKASQFMLSGTNGKVHDGNPKWAYVKAAMNATSGQFHDRHLDYSRQVQGYLSKVAEAFAQMYDRSTDPVTGCPKCKDAERPAGADASLIGPPYMIVFRLTAGSNFFRRHVNTEQLTARNIYTSNWVKAWFAASTEEKKMSD